jgi:hypothetical protein
MHPVGLNARFAAGTIAGLLAITGCHQPPASRPKVSEPPQPPPCSGSALTQAYVARPYFQREPGEFTTDGSELHFSAYGFNSGNVFDSLMQSTEVFVGPASTPPTYDEATGVVTPFTKTFKARPERYTAVELPAGRYWIWSTSPFPNIEILACTANAVTVTKLRLTPEPTPGGVLPEPSPRGPS